MQPLPRSGRRQPYRNSNNTNVLETFKQFGWKEPNRNQQKVAFMRLNDLDFRLAELLKAQRTS